MKMHQYDTLLFLITMAFCSAYAMENEPSVLAPQILIKNNNNLFGIVGKEVCIWELSSDNNIESVSVLDWSIKGEYSREQIIRCALASRDTKRLYLGGGSGGIRILDADTLEEIESKITNHSYFDDLKAFAENGDGDLISANGNGDIRIWDIMRGESKGRITTAPYFLCIKALLADDKKIYAVGRTLGGVYWEPGDDILVGFDTRTMKPMFTINTYHGDMYHLEPSKKATQFYSSSQDGTVIVWDKRNMTNFVRTIKSNGAVKCVKESADGKILFTAGDAGIEVWDLNSDIAPYIVGKLINEAVRCMDCDATHLFAGTDSGIEILSVKRLIQKDEEEL